MDCYSYDSAGILEVFDTLDRVLCPFFASYIIAPSSILKCCVVRGELILDNQLCDYRFSRTANVNVSLNPQDLIGFQPKVEVNERWLRHSADWHCDDDNCLCWELNERWRVELSRVARSRPPLYDFMNYAISWCLESSVCLISRHWYAHMENIPEWPSTWECWGHFAAGRKEYEREKRKQERKKFNRQNQ